MPSKHALLAPSASKRWLACTPSAVLESMQPSSESIFALEGTHAHAMSELLLNLYSKGMVVAVKSYGSMMQNEDFATLVDTITADGFDAEEMYGIVMKGYVKPVIEDFESCLDLDREASLYVEAELKLDAYIPESFGSSDSIIVYDSTMVVNDLKYGMGVKVDAENNSQMMCYALGAYETMKDKYDIKNIVMIIYQPRLSHISHFTISTDELLVWAVAVLKPTAEKAFRGEGKLSSGEHCKFCRFKAHCPEQHALMSHVQVENYMQLSNDQLAELLPMIPTVRGYLDSVEEYAKGLILSGAEVPGWKVVEGRAYRKIVDTEGAVKALKAQGITDDFIYEKKLKTITSLEKGLGKKGFEAILGSFVVVPQGAPTLVPSSDKRPAMSTTSVFDEMNNLLGQ